MLVDSSAEELEYDPESESPWSDGGFNHRDEGETFFLFTVESSSGLEESVPNSICFCYLFTNYYQASTISMRFLTCSKFCLHHLDSNA